MKRSWLTYHRAFPWTPMSGWAGARLFGWASQRTASGQWKRPRQVPHPFPTSLKLWCLLHVDFDGVGLIFATPRELDQFLDVMGQRLLPSGPRLAATWGGSTLKGPSLGRPNNHWLSRLPAKAKPWRFRRSVIAYLKNAREARAFREFYARTPPTYDAPGIVDHWTAWHQWKRGVAAARHP
jgi:hypothetical protein